jgi:hypothetical protein
MMEMVIPFLHLFGKTWMVEAQQQHLLQPQLTEGLQHD